MKSRSTLVEPEFSRPLAVDKIPPSGLTEILEANERQRAALAARFGLIELPKFHAEFSIAPSGLGRAVAVTGKVVADAVQRCVVTLEPLPAHIETGVDVVFAAAPKDDAPDIDPEDGETELIVDGLIDLGELAAQHLGIALDPYPRKEGALFGAAEYGTNEKRENPFARLAELSKKPKDTH